MVSLVKLPSQKVGTKCYILTDLSLKTNKIKEFLRALSLCIVNQVVSQ